MKVAILSSLLRAVSPASAGGTEAFTSILTEGLLVKGIDVSLFATSDSQTKAKLHSICSSAQTTGVFEGSVAGNMLFELLQARNFIPQSHEFDIIHNNYWSYYSFSCFSSFTEKPVITTMHNHFWQYPNMKEMLVKTHTKGKDLVVFASQAAKNMTEGLIDAEVIPHGINPESFPFSAQSGDYVLWFSRLIKDKGIKHAMDAAKQGNFKLIAAGSPPIKPHNKEYIDEQVMPFFSDDIKYVGTPTETEKRSLYQNAKAFIFPTLVDEQFGLVLVEAMSSGTPVIGYNRGAVAEVIKDGVTGFVVDPDDEPRPGKGSWIIKKQGIEGLIEAVNRIDEIDRAACRAHVEANFTLERMIDQYISLYTKVANR